MDKRIIISGGSGLIGSRLVKALHAKGYHICVLSRNPDRAADSTLLAHEHIKFVPGETDLVPVIEGAFAVINLAGASIAGKRWSGDYKKQILKSRINTTLSITNAISLAREKPEVFFSASAVGYYGDGGDERIDETSPTGSGFLAEVCRKWEDAANTASENTRVINGRIGVVLDKNGGALAKFIPAFKAFAGGPLGSGKQWMPWVHITDLVNMIIWAIEKEDVTGPLNIVSPQPVTMSRFARTLGRILKRPAVFHTPSFALKLILGESAEMVLTGQKAYPNKAMDLGYEFKYNNIEKALEEIMG